MSSYAVHGPGDDLARTDSPRFRAEMLLSNQRGLYILRILMYGVTPAVSVFGIVGNAFSLVVLQKQRGNRCSNIILFHLALADLLFLISFNGVPKILYEVAFDSRGFHFSPAVTRVLFVLHVVLNTIDYGMSTVSLVLPVLITLERIVAVFLPLHVHRLVTPYRTRLAILGVYVMSFSMKIYMSMSFRLRFETTVASGARNVSSPGPPTIVGHFDQTSGSVAALMDAVAYLGFRIPPVITFVGCVFIAIKIRLVAIRRRQMTSAAALQHAGSAPSKGKAASDETVSRTTKMLLAVCAMYTFTCCVLSLPSMFPQYSSFTVTDNSPTYLQLITYQLLNIVMCLNSSCNFLIYVVMNKNFRDTYKSLFRNCRCSCFLN